VRGNNQTIFNNSLFLLPLSLSSPTFYNASFYSIFNLSHCSYHIKVPLTDCDVCELYLWFGMLLNVYSFKLCSQKKNIHTKIEFYFKVWKVRFEGRLFTCKLNSWCFSNEQKRTFAGCWRWKPIERRLWSSQVLSVLVF
jgi:hypothetical protein